MNFVVVCLIYTKKSSYPSKKQPDRPWLVKYSAASPTFLTQTTFTVVQHFEAWTSFILCRGPDPCTSEKIIKTPKSINTYQFLLFWWSHTTCITPHLSVQSFIHMTINSKHYSYGQWTPLHSIKSLYWAEQCSSWRLFSLCKLMNFQRRENPNLVCQIFSLCYVLRDYIKMNTNSLGQLIYWKPAFLEGRAPTTSKVTTFLTTVLPSFHIRSLAGTRSFQTSLWILERLAGWLSFLNEWT